MAENVDIIGPGLTNNGLKFQNEKEHIVQNVKRILMTRRGEQVGDLSFGSDLKKYLFILEIGRFCLWLYTQKHRNYHIFNCMMLCKHAIIKSVKQY